MLNRILLISGVLGLVVLVPSMLLLFRGKQYFTASMDLLIYAAVLILLFGKKIPYAIRAVSFIAIAYLLAIILLLVLEGTGGGPIWLFFAPVLTAILLGGRASLVSLCLNVIVITTAGFFLDLGNVMPMEGRAYAFRWIVISLNFMLLNILATMSIPFILHGLQESIKEGNNSRKKYLRIFDNILDVYFEISLSGEILELSPSAEKLSGSEYKKLIGSTIFDFVSEEADDFFEKIKSSGGVENYDFVFNTFDGTTKYCSVNARLSDDDPDRDETIIGIVRDISSVKEAEDENRALEERLVRSEKMESLGLLAGGVAHDLNNILSAIISLPEIMLTEIPEDHKFTEYLNALKSSGEKAAAIVDDLLGLTRRGVVIRDSVNLRSVVESFMESPECSNLKKLYPEIGISVDFSPEEPIITGSFMHLHKVVMNLVNNAAEARTDNVKILISNKYGFEKKDEHFSVPLNDYAVLAVIDDGEGIDKEDIPMIFEPFFSRKVMGRSGTGLGMSVVWGTVMDHEGYISVNSEKNQGTEVEIYLPLSGKSIKEHSAGR